MNKRHAYMIKCLTEAKDNLVYKGSSGREYYVGICVALVRVGTVEIDPNVIKSYAYKPYYTGFVFENSHIWPPTHEYLRHRKLTINRIIASLKDGSYPNSKYNK